VRILLDENLDWRLSRELVGHAVDSVPLIGWSGTKNGALLRRAVEAGYDVFITIDGGIFHQQNVEKLGLAVVALRAKTNRLGDTKLLMPEVLSMLDSLAPGTLTFIGGVGFESFLIEDKFVGTQERAGQLRDLTGDVGRLASGLIGSTQRRSIAKAGAAVLQLLPTCYLLATIS
jgi:hypothetical protein